jgi:hypothetical protein
MWRRLDEVIHDVDVEFNAGRLAWNYEDISRIIWPYPKHGKRGDTVHSDKGSDPGDVSDAGGSGNSDGSSDGGDGGDDGFPVAARTLRTCSAVAEPSGVAQPPAVAVQSNGAVPLVLARTVAEADTVHTSQNKLDVLRVVFDKVQCPRPRLPTMHPRWRMSWQPRASLPKLLPRASSRGLR